MYLLLQCDTTLLLCELDLPNERELESKGRRCTSFDLFDPKAKERFFARWELRSDDCQTERGSSRWISTSESRCRRRPSPFSISLDFDTCAPRSSCFNHKFESIPLANPNPNFLTDKRPSCASNYCSYLPLWHLPLPFSGTTCSRDSRRRHCPCRQKRPTTSTWFSTARILSWRQPFPIMSTSESEDLCESSPVVVWSESVMSTCLSIRTPRYVLCLIREMRMLPRQSALAYDMNTGRSRDLRRELYILHLHTDRSTRIFLAWLQVMIHFVWLRLALQSLTTMLRLRQIYHCWNLITRRHCHTIWILSLQ